jgi:serine/threonine protein kinase
MHGQNVIHRDLKLENILLDRNSDNQTKIIDFGFSCTVESIEESRLTG